MSIPLPIPETWQENAGQVARGSLLDIAWKLFVIVAVMLLAVALVSLGPIGAGIGSILLWTLLSEEVRKTLSDVWHRRWAEIELPL
ncbi:MAG: hypothetical protein ACOCQY_05080 [Halorhabdus sp.]